MGELTIADMKKLQAAWQAQQLQNTAGSNQQITTPTYPGMHIPVTIPPGGSYIQYQGYGPQRVKLSDFDIELMAACIANKHPVVEGQSHCFCTLKRLERGISKD